MSETLTLDNVFRQEEVLDLNVSFNEFEEEDTVTTNAKLTKTSETCSLSPRRDFENEISDGEIDSQEHSHRFLHKNNENGEKENCRKTLKETSNEKLEIYDLREKLDNGSRAKRRPHSAIVDSCHYNDYESLTNYSSEENLKQFKKQRLECMEVDGELETTQQASEGCYYNFKLFLSIAELCACKYTCVHSFTRSQSKSRG